MKMKILKGLRTLTIMLLAMAANAGAVDIQIDNGTVLLGSDIQDIKIDPVTGVIQVTTVSGTWDIVDSGPPSPGDPVPVVSLTVNGAGSATADTGTNVTLAWTVSSAASCTTANGNPTWLGTAITLTSGAASGSKSIPVDFEGATPFTLSCVNGANTTNRSVTVTGVTPTPTPTGNDCPADYTPSLAGDTITWYDVYGYNWPDPSLSERTLTVRRAGYLAISFNTGDHPEMQGGITTITKVGTDGDRLIAFSPCPGDFSQYLPGSVAACTELEYNGGGLLWSTETAPRLNECKLKANTTYYANLTFTDGLSSSTDRCSGTLCRTILRAYQR